MCSFEPHMCDLQESQDSYNQQHKIVADLRRKLKAAAQHMPVPFSPHSAAHSQASAPPRSPQSSAAGLEVSGGVAVHRADVQPHADKEAEVCLCALVPWARLCSVGQAMADLLGSPEEQKDAGNEGGGGAAHRNTARQAMDGLWTEVRGQQQQSNDPGNNQHILNTPTIGRR